MPTSEPFSRVCTIVPYPSSANKGMYHRYGVWHESPLSPHVPRFTGFLSTTRQAPAPLPGVCFLSTARSTPIAHFERSCSPAGWICGKRASGHRGGAWSERLAPTCRTERARCGQTVAGHPVVRPQGGAFGALGPRSPRRGEYKPITQISIPTPKLYLRPEIPGQPSAFRRDARTHSDSAHIRP